MSWSAYPDQLISGGCCAAAVYGLDGSLWAHSGSPAAPASGQALLSHMNEKKTSKINFYGQEFVVLRTDGETLYAKQGSGGFAAKKSGKALVVGVYNQDMQPGQCNNVVENLADYLSNNGY